MLSAICPLFAQASVEEQISNVVSSWFSVEVKQVKGLALRNVFDCDFYTATPNVSTTDGESSFGHHLFLHNDEIVEAFSGPSTTQPLPELTQCIKRDFSLTSTEQADVLLEALDTLFVSYGAMREIEPYVMNKGTHWELVNDKFFDSFSGYVVKTTAKGTIKSVSYSLELKGK